VCGCQFGYRGTRSVLVAPAVKMSCRIRYGVFTVVDTNALQMDASIFFEDSDSHPYQTVRYNDTEDRIRNCTV